MAEIAKMVIKWNCDLYNDGQRPTVGPGKDFQKKNERRRLNGRNSKPKSDIVMGPTGKMLVTHRAPNVPLTKIDYRFQVDTHYGGRHVPLFPTEKSAEIEKGQFLQKNKGQSDKIRGHHKKKSISFHF